MKRKPGWWRESDMGAIPFSLNSEAQLPKPENDIHRRIVFVPRKNGISLLHIVYAFQIFLLFSFVSHLEFYCVLILVSQIFFFAA